MEGQRRVCQWVGPGAEEVRRDRCAQRRGCSGDVARTAVRQRGPERSCLLGRPRPQLGVVGSVGRIPDYQSAQWISRTVIRVDVASLFGRARPGLVGRRGRYASCHFGAQSGGRPSCRGGLIRCRAATGLVQSGSEQPFGRGRCEGHRFERPLFHALVSRGLRTERSISAPSARPAHRPHLGRRARPAFGGAPDRHDGRGVRCLAAGPGCVRGR